MKNYHPTAMLMIALDNEIKRYETMIKEQTFFKTDDMQEVLRDYKDLMKTLQEKEQEVLEILYNA